MRPVFLLSALAFGLHCYAAALPANLNGPGLSSRQWGGGGFGGGFGGGWGGQGGGGGEEENPGGGGEAANDGNDGTNQHPKLHSLIDKL